MEPEQLIVKLKDDPKFLLSTIALNNPQDVSAQLRAFGVDVSENPQSVFEGLMLVVRQISPMDAVTLLDVPLDAHAPNETADFVPVVKNSLASSRMGDATWSGYFTGTVTALRDRLLQDAGSSGESDDSPDIPNETHKTPCCAKCARKQQQMIEVMAGLGVLLLLIWIIKHWN